VGLKRWLTGEPRRTSSAPRLQQTSRRTPDSPERQQPIPTRATAPQPHLRPPSASQLQIVLDSRFRVPDLSPERPDDAIWVSSGRSVEVGGTTISGGSFYLGSSLRSVGSFRGTEPALVDPALPVDFTAPDWSGSSLSYWPSYDKLNPHERAAYLSWLASPRDTSQVAIGYVFLYFYGLERRAFVDGLASPEARSEWPWIAAEVERLRAFYGHDHSFQSYASNLLTTLRYLLEPAGIPEGPPPPVERDQNRLALCLQPDIRLGLGRIVAAGRPIPASWAIAWLQASPEVFLRTPASRCSDEFARLFTLRYNERFGQGMVIKPNKTRLRIPYRAASSSFGPEIELPVEDLPDISALTAPITVLKELAQGCTDALDSYSRWLGRHPTERDSLTGAALLPPELAHDATNAALDELTQWLESQLIDRDEAFVDSVELVHRWPAQTPGKLTRAEASALAQLLAARGYGMEPDVRFAGPILGLGEAVVFRLDGPQASAGPAWESAAAVLQLAAAVAAPGARSEVVLTAVADEIQSSLHLPASERGRIHAHLRWATTVTPSLTAAKRALVGADHATRESIARFLVDIAAAHSDVGPAQVSALTKAYKALQLEPASMYALIHERTAHPGAGEPIEIRPAQPANPGEAIPPPARAQSPGAIILNHEAIRAKLTESAKAAALLGEIFTDEEVDSSLAVAKTTDLRVLSAAHVTFLRELAVRPRWSRADFVELASHLDLLPAAATEALNDAALEACGDPVLEGDDIIEVNSDALKELLS
jgi:hypothetical protein